MAVSSIGEKYFPIFIIQNQKQTALTGEEDLEFEAGFKKVDCIIYMYCKPGTDFGVYAGQTMQTLKQRDKQHLGKREQEFDKVYTSKSKFDLKELEKKTFTAEIQSKSEWRRFIKSYGEWMDEREKYYIKKYDTWKGEHGFNQNEGGQGLSQHVRRAQSAFKRRLTKFRTKYWPAMQAFLKTKKAKLPGGTPSLLMVKRNEPIIGTLIDHIRNDETSVPAFYKKLMIEHGHSDNHSEGMWKQVYWPAMLAFLKTEKAKLPGGTPSLLMVKENEKIIGKLISNIRHGHISVPAFYKKMLDEHGMFWSKSNVAKHLLRKLGIRRHVSTRKFEIDRNISLDPAENEEIAVCLEKSRCFLLDEKFNGSKVKMAAKKHTGSRETFIEKYRKDLQSIVEKE